MGIEVSKLTFNPSISFDGVAMITACVACSIWFGSMSETIKNHTQEINHITQILDQLSQADKLQQQNIAVLTTIVNERLKKQ